MTFLNKLHVEERIKANNIPEYPYLGVHHKWESPPGCGHTTANTDDHKALKTEVAQLKAAQLKEVQTGTPSTLTSPPTKMQFLRFCYRCGLEGHFKDKCVNPPNAELVQKNLCRQVDARRNVKKN